MSRAVNNVRLLAAVRLGANAAVVLYLCGWWVLVGLQEVPPPEGADVALWHFGMKALVIALLSGTVVLFWHAWRYARRDWVTLLSGAGPVASESVSACLTRGTLEAEEISAAPVARAPLQDLVTSTMMSAVDEARALIRARVWGAAPLTRVDDEAMLQACRTLTEFADAVSPIIRPVLDELEAARQAAASWARERAALRRELHARATVTHEAAALVALVQDMAWSPEDVQTLRLSGANGQVLGLAMEGLQDAVRLLGGSSATVGAGAVGSCAPRAVM